MRNTTMRDMRADLGGVWRTANRMPIAPGGRVCLFVSAHDEDGMRDVATSFALIAAARASRPVWLLDLDFRHNHVFGAFEDGFAKGIGKPAKAYDGGLQSEPIYTSMGKGPLRTRGTDPNRLLTLHAIEGTGLLVSRFRTEALAEGERLRLQASPDWWRAARQRADWICVTAPALDKSGAGLVACNEADGVILVVRADHTPTEDVALMREEIESHGGRILGAVMTHVGADARLASRFAA